VGIAGVVATQFQTIQPHPWSLFVRGLDLIRPLGQQAQAPGIDPGDLKVTSRGPNAPGTLEFTIDDPFGTLIINDGDDVRFMDNGNDVIVWYGFVERVTYRPHDVGQAIDVVANDIDIMLDWLCLAADMPTFTITGSTTIEVATFIQSALEQCIGCGVQLRAFVNTGGAAAASSQAVPLQAGQFLLFSDTGVLSIAPTKGSSLRSILQSLAQNIYQQDLVTFVLFYANPSAMVDEWQGLRWWGLAHNDGIVSPSDWPALQISDTAAGPTRAAGLEHTLDAAAVIRSLVLIGGDFTFNYNDGTGKPGKTSVVTDAAMLVGTLGKPVIDAWAQNYLHGFAAKFRGQAPIEDWTPTPGVHVGGPVTVLDPSAPQASGSYTIGQIDRTFHGSGRQDWTVTYGGIRASGAVLMRRLTRSVRQ